jgi:hypothetical protein
LRFFSQERITPLFPLLAAFWRHILRFLQGEQGTEQFTSIPVIQAGQVEQQTLQDQVMVAGFAFGVLALA